MCTRDKSRRMLTEAFDNFATSQGTSNQDSAPSSQQVDDAEEPLVKRGRGRPPKPKDDARESPVKRGRGRPPKPKDDTGESPAKRGRGRPPKPKDDAIEFPVKRGRGRPPKPKDDTGESPVKRGRGRPPKFKDDTDERIAKKRCEGSSTDILGHITRLQTQMTFVKKELSSISSILHKIFDETGKNTIIFFSTKLHLFNF